jgi:Tol biopolymer transport system component
VIGAVAALVAAPSAQAAFPGGNGQIVFAGATARYGFYVMTPSAEGIYLVDPESASRRPLRVGADGAVGSDGFARPSWSPAGSRIAYSHYRSGGTTLEVMNHDGSDGQVLGRSSDGLWWPAWSPDGSMIVTGGADESLRLMDTDGQNRRVIDVSGAEPAWSPDCSRIAVSSTAHGEIRTITADGAVHAVAQGWSPDWSPDGARILFWSWNEAVDATLYVINADGSDKRDLGRGYFPAWSPDGKQIAFTDRFGGISVMNADGTDPRQLVVGGTTWSSDPDWQPSPAAPVEPGACDAWRFAGREAMELRLSVAPTRTRVGRATRFRFRVTGVIDSEASPVRGAQIRFAGRRARTGARGRAMINRRFGRPGRYEAIARKSDLSSASATVRVVRR